MATRRKIENPQMSKGRKKGYTVPKGEENSIHAEIEQVKFSIIGEKESTPSVQKFDPRAWSNFVKYHLNLGYTYVKTLHVPKGIDSYEHTPTTTK